MFCTNRVVSKTKKEYKCTRVRQENLLSQNSKVEIRNGRFDIKKWDFSIEKRYDVCTMHIVQSVEFRRFLLMRKGTKLIYQKHQFCVEKYLRRNLHRHVPETILDLISSQVTSVLVEPSILCTASTYVQIQNGRGSFFVLVFTWSSFSKPSLKIRTRVTVFVLYVHRQEIYRRFQKCPCFCPYDLF